MTVLLNATNESGSNGATVTTANSPFTQFVDATGVIYSNATLLPSGAGGSMAMRTTGAGTTSASATAPITATATPFFRSYLYVSQRPTGNTAIVQLLGANGTTVRAELQLGATGTLRMRGNDFVALATSPADTIPLNAWCRIEWAFNNTTLKQEVRVFSGSNLHGTTPSWTSGSLTTPGGTNGGTAAYVYLGVIQNTAVLTATWDETKVADDTWVGPVVTAVEPPPVADAGPDQIIDPYAATSYTLNGAASTGTITTYLWEDITGTATTVSGSGATRSVTAPIATTDTTRTYRLTVTGPGGTSTDTVTVVTQKWRTWRMVGTTLTAVRRKPRPTIDTTPPSVPGTPVATAGVNSVTVVSSGSTDAVGVVAYDWYQDFDQTPTVSTTGPSLTQNGLPAGVSTYYRVRARDAAGNASALSLASNSVTPTAPASAGAIVYGSCPHNSGGVSGALSKWYTNKPIAMRVFSSGGLDGAIPTRPAGIGRLHYSYKPGGNATFTRAQIVRACTNLVAGDILEVEHEHDNDTNYVALTATKRNFADAVRAAREAGDIPNILTCDTFTGWALSTSNSGAPTKTDAYLDARYGESDLVGCDMDGIDPQGYSSFSDGWPTTGTPLYFNFFDREAPRTIDFMTRKGYTGWCVPEFSTFRHPTNDANGNIRVAWMNWQVAKFAAASVKPNYVAFFDFSNRPAVADHLECLELTNEINAWKSAIATNPA